jgi:SAM-dependent methyltransferase
MPGLGWLDVKEISFNTLLLLEPFHVQYIAEREPNQAMGTALQAHPAVKWYLDQTYPPISEYIAECLALAKATPSPKALRQAEITVLNSMQDWLIYILEPKIYDNLEFLGWDDASLLNMADFQNKVVLDIGAGTGRLAFTVAPKASVVYAVEPVANLRRYIWQKSSWLGFSNVYPIDGAITQIPLADNFADILMAGHVFGENFEQEYQEMRRVVRNEGIVLLHPGTNAFQDDEAHNFLINTGFDFDTFTEPGDGLKRKYWKTIIKEHQKIYTRR